MNTGLNAKGGSFGVPPEVMQAVNESKKKAGQPEAEPEYKDSESIPEVEPEAPKKEAKKEEERSEEKTPEENIAEMKAQALKDLGIEITEDDIWSLLYKNQLENGRS